jgi:6-phosphogluconolactonase
MKFNHIGRKVFAGAVSALLALGTTSCSRDYVAAFVYTVSAANGNVSAFAVDYQTGILNQIDGSPFATNFSNPTTVVASPNGKYIYVIGGTQNSQVEEFAVGTDGKVYGQHTYTLTGSYPTGATIDTNGKFLFVTYTYQQGFTPASPGPGGVTVFPISSTDGSLGTAINQNVGNTPVGVTVSAPVTSNGNAVYAYVLDQGDQNMLGFKVNTSTGALTVLPGTTVSATAGTGYHVGVSPSALAIDPTARFVYVTDKSLNELIGFQLTSTGDLTALTSGAVATGLYPVSVTVEPRGKYVFTANYNSGTVTAFTINASTGFLTGSVGSGSFSVATGPTCVTVEPALGIYLYTSNYLDGSVSGGQLSPNTGQLSAIANTPFPTQSLPSCIASVANGEHATQLVNPS